MVSVWMIAAWEAGMTGTKPKEKSSPMKFFRPKPLQNKKKRYLCTSKRCPDGEMVDTLVSGAGASRHVGSSPILGTSEGGGK